MVKLSVLVAPAHYLFSDKTKSEVAWSYALVKYLSEEVENLDVICGVSDLSVPLPSNVHIYSLFPCRSNSVVTEFIRHLIFYPLVTLVAFRLILQRKYSVIHHMLPLSYATFNPLVLVVRVLFRHIKVVIGPLQLPQVVSDPQDLNVVYLGKQKYSIASKVVYHLTMLISSLIQPLSKLMFESAHAVVCNSSTSLDFYKKKYPAAKFKVIYTGLDQVNQQKFAKKTQKKTVHLLSAGAFSIRKGQIYLLQAMTELVKRHPDIRLTLIGDGDQNLQYRDFVTQNKLTKFVKFTGQISYSELLKAYAQHDVFCLPSLSDTSPYVILEAMAFGLPIVTTNVGSVKEMVGSAGLIVRPADVKDLLNAIDKLISNPNLRSSMSVTGYARVQSQFLWSSIIPKWVSVYKD